MLRHVLLVLVVLSLVAVLLSCSKAQVYEPPTNRVVSVDAVNINTATVDELEKLPHIGHKTAESIIEFRTANGPFRRAEHLMQIRGISEERFLELRPFIKTE